MKTDISVIVPVHELHEGVYGLFANAIKSIAEQVVIPDEVLIVTPKGSKTEEYLKAYEFPVELTGKINIIAHEEKTDFSSQVNIGVSASKTEWFSILEFDDEYANIWFKNVVTYIGAHPEVNMFLPIIVDVDSNGTFIGLTNEAVWANSFSDELGILDQNALLTYQNFNIDGFVMKKQLFEENGGLKSNIKLTFIYEFLLRMTFKDLRVMVIPRFGYKHVNQRDGSLFATYKASLDPIEAKWWLAQAKKQYYFDTDRTITYDSTTA